MSDAANIEAWQGLARRTPHFSVLQERPFVQAWYANYAEDYEPLLCLAQHRNGKLIALMALAIHRADRSVQHAGVHFAEYHGWLCEKGFENAFPLEFVLALRDVISTPSWAWRWLPPGASWTWLHDPRIRTAGIHSHVVERENYVIELTDANLKAIRRRKSLRNNLNRLSRGACLEMVEITDPAQARRLYEAIAPMYDLRMGAIYGHPPIHADKRRKQFFLQRQQHKALSCVYLMRDGDPIAFNLGARDRKRVLLGFFGFNPLFGQFSPGTVFILQLGEYLRAQGYELLDLTPGRQRYKEQLSNRSETLVLPTLLFSNRARGRAVVRDRINDGGRFFLKAIGIQTPQERSDFQKRMARRFTRLSQFGVWDISLKFCRQIYAQSEICYYYADVNTVEPQPSTRGINCGEQQLTDFLRLRPDLMESGKRQELMRCVLQRAEAGQRAFTVIKDGFLAHYGWVEFIDRQRRLPKSNIILELPEGSALLSEFFTDPIYRREGLYANTILRMLEYCKKRGTGIALIEVDRRNVAVRQVIERMGFECYCRVRRYRLAWISHARISLRSTEWKPTWLGREEGVVVLRASAKSEVRYGFTGEQSGHQDFEEKGRATRGKTCGNTRPMVEPL